MNKNKNSVTGRVCPACRQPVHNRPAKSWNPERGRPRWSHLDGEVLCPIRVLGSGYKHANPTRTRGRSQ